MKKDTTQLKKKMEKAEKDALKLKITVCDRINPTLDLIIMAIGRCCALFIKAFIIGLAIKSALF